MHDARQPAWLAIVKGMAIGVFTGIFLVFLTISIGLFILPRNRTDIAVEILGLFLFYGLPLMLVFGGLFGWLFLRQIKRRHRAWLLVSCMTFLVSCKTLVIGNMLWNNTLELPFHEYQQRQQEQRTPRVLVINFSPHTIATNSPFDGYKSLIYHPLEFPPLSNDSPDMPAKDRTLVSYGQQTPKWNKQLTMQISWCRPRHGHDFKYEKDPRIEGANLLIDYIRFSATVHLPPYQGVKNKVFAVVFLPGDQVCVEVVDTPDQPVALSSVNHTYVVQGTILDPD